MNDEPTLRKVINVIEPGYVLEGAGVKLRRSIGTRTVDNLDPFLLFDHFGSDDPKDYIKGFPMHPHRGIETVTYMLAGMVRHEDSLGNQGEISAGDVQWMTAGRGILHEEMPEGIGNHMEGFQLWVNLPASLKMSPPRYQEIPEASIPWLNPSWGITIRLIAGKLNEFTGPVTEIAADPVYMDVSVDASAVFEYKIESNHTALAYVFKGGGDFCGTTVEATRMVVFGEGNRITIKGGLFGTRFLLISGKPLNEPIARYGPLVMNTQEEIQQALRELRNGTFITK